MADNDINVVFNAVTDGFQAGINSVNKALEFQKIPSDVASTPIGQLFSSMQRSSDLAIASMIKGTENWQAATVKILQDMEIKFAQLFANKLLNETVANALGLKSSTDKDAAEITSSQLKNDAIASSDQLASNTSIASHASQIIKQIQTDSAATYAGVYANLSPVLGPAAAVPAGVSAGAVAAMEGLVSLDVGAWNLGSDTIAQLHQGEMVVPQTFAEGLRSGNGIGGGGDNYTININAIDTQTGAQFIKNNASGIVSAIASQVRNFNSNVPAWKS